jgi:hypothetical protein
MRACGCVLVCMCVCECVRALMNRHATRNTSLDPGLARVAGEQQQCEKRTWPYTGLAAASTLQRAFSDV